MKNIGFRTVFIAFFLVLLQGCAHTNSTFSTTAQSSTPSDKVVESLLLMGKVVIDQDLVAFKRDGHFYTVNFVLQVAGVNSSRADRLGCFSQAPDEIAKYNAVPVSMFGVFNWEKRSHIVNALHSLHGGNHQAVLKRRTGLQSLIRESFVQARPDWETGFLIHALGDSFAHVKGDFDNSTAYGEVVGHGFALQDPDDIYAGDNYKKYNGYIIALFDAIADPRNIGGRLRLVDFAQQLEAVVLEKRVHGKDLKDILVRQTNTANTISACKNMFAEIGDREALDFLANLAGKLK